MYFISLPIKTLENFTLNEFFFFFGFVFKSCLSFLKSLFQVLRKIFLPPSKPGVFELLKKYRKKKKGIYQINKTYFEKYSSVKDPSPLSRMILVEVGAAPSIVVKL